MTDKAPPRLITFSEQPMWLRAALLIIVVPILAFGYLYSHTVSSTPAVRSNPYEMSEYDRCVHDNGAHLCGDPKDYQSPCIIKSGKIVSCDKEFLEEFHAKTNAALDRTSHQLRAMARNAQLKMDLDRLRDDRKSGRISSAEWQREMDRIEREGDDAEAEFNRWK